MKPTLLGSWVVDPEDEAARAQFGDVTMTFEPDGSLTYLISTDEKNQVMLLRYRVEDGVLITDQPSSPREERTKLDFTPDGRLVLTYGGVRARYVRRPPA